MKKVLLFLTFLWFVACQNDALTLQSEGIITQRDYRKCYCCGGMFIQIEGETYRYNFTPDQREDLHLEREDFPIPIRLNWEKIERPCLGDEIVVTRVERR